MTKINVKLDSKAKNVISKTAGISGGGGGLTPIDKLPEKGKVGALYKTPDGNIYSWFHEETQKEVEVPPTLEVGKTYQLKEQILFKTFADSINNALGDPNKRSQHKSIEGDIVNDNLSFNMYFSRDFEGTGTSTYSAMFSYLEEADNKIRYFYNEGKEQPDEYVHRQIIGWTGPAEITVTQEWIDNLSENWGEPFDINNLNFLFVGSTETVTVVNEGYTQLNGIVLDYNNIINNSIYLDDKNYNAQIIYDTLLRGGSALLKFPENEDEFSLYCLKSSFFGAFEYGAPNVFMHFENQDVNVILKNQFDPISTIKGQELIDLAQKFGNDTNTNNQLLFKYLEFILRAKSTSEDLSSKELKDGHITVSMFEGLIQYKLETVNNMYESINFRKDSPHTYEIWTAKPHEDVTSVNYISNAGSINAYYIPQDDFSNINPTKDYSCDITVYFEDDTSIIVSMDRSLIYPKDGDEGFFIYVGE